MKISPLAISLFPAIVGTLFLLPGTSLAKGVLRRSDAEKDRKLQVQTTDKQVTVNGGPFTFDILAIADGRTIVDILPLVVPQGTLVTCELACTLGAGQKILAAYETEYNNLSDDDGTNGPFYIFTSASCPVTQYITYAHAASDLVQTYVEFYDEATFAAISGATIECFSEDLPGYPTSAPTAAPVTAAPSAAPSVDPGCGGGDEESSGMAKLLSAFGFGGGN